MTRSRVTLATLFLFALPAALAAQVATRAAGDVGMAAPALERLATSLDSTAAAGGLPGGVLLVARDGQVVLEHAFGWRDRETRSAMRPDAIFRIASMSKLLTTVGVLMLQEQGALLLSDPVSKYIPAFAHTTVAVAGEDGGYDVVPAKRAITLRDLLTHTAGIGYGYGPARAAWEEAGIVGWYFGHREEPIGETVARMAALPFDAQPGEAFVYGYATDILGAVIEVASGQPFDAFLRERILTPLGMHDTQFYLDAARRDRLAVVYSIGTDGVLVRAPDESAMQAQGAYADGPRASFSGGAGLLSTAADYGRFLQMLLNGGTLDDVRLLSPKSVELMTANHVGSLYPWEPGVGFGLGVFVVENLGARGLPGSVGEYGWNGAYHTASWVDPQERLVVVYLTQVIPATGLTDFGRVRAGVYGAVVESYRAMQRR